MNSPSGKACLFDLYPQDMEAISRIRERLQVNSDALTVRLAIRSLAKRLANPTILQDKSRGNETPFIEQIRQWAEQEGVVVTVSPLEETTKATGKTA